VVYSEYAKEKHHQGDKIIWEIKRKETIPGIPIGSPLSL